MCGRSVCMRISSALLLVVAFQWRSGRLLVVLAVGGSVYSLVLWYRNPKCSEIPVRILTSCTSCSLVSGMFVIVHLRFSKDLRFCNNSPLCSGSLAIGNGLSLSVG